MKSPEWRQQLRRADLRQFQILRHGPVIIYTRLPAGGTYYSICMFPTNSERLIGISDAFSAFVYWYPSSCPCAHVPPTKLCLLCATPAGLDLYKQTMPVDTYRVQSLNLRRSSIVNVILKGRNNALRYWHSSAVNVFLKRSYYYIIWDIDITQL